MPRLRHYLELHFIIFLWGFTAILGKIIEIPTVELVFLRTAIAAVALAVIVLYTIKTLRLPGKVILQLLGVGLMIAGHWLLFFASARVSSVSICLAGMATCSLWTAILEPAFTDKKLQTHEILLALLIMLGLYIIFRFEFDHALGISMAVASAVLGAGFTIANSRLTKKYPATTISCYEMAGAALGTAIFFPLYLTNFASTGALDFSLSTMDWIFLLILTLACTVYAYTASVRLMQHITAYSMNLSVNLEPIYGIVLAYFIFGDAERMSAGFYAGASIILASVFIYPILENYIRRKQKVKNLQQTFPD